MLLVHIIFFDAVPLTRRTPHLQTTSSPEALLQPLRPLRPLTPLTPLTPAYTASPGVVSVVSVVGITSACPGTSSFNRLIICASLSAWQKGRMSRLRSLSGGGGTLGPPPPVALMAVLFRGSVLPVGRHCRFILTVGTSGERRREAEDEGRRKPGRRSRARAQRETDLSLWEDFKCPVQSRPGPLWAAPRPPTVPGPHS